MPNVRIEVAFYNEEEREKFERNLPAEFWFHEGNRRIILEIPYEDFQTYMIFQHQDHRAGLVTFNDFCQNIYRFWGDFDHYFSI